jgi:hypothetical protein
MTRRVPLKPISREIKKAATMLQECRCFDEVKRRLRLGWSANKLATFIQEENKELTEVTHGYVVNMVNAIPPAELLLTTQSTSVAMSSAQKVSNGMEEIEKLNELYELQMSRINIDVAHEKNLNKLFSSTGREIFYAMKILKQTSDLKMDLGLAKRQLGEMSVNGTSTVQLGERYTEGVAKVLTDPDSRRKVLGMVESLMALGAKASIDATEIVRNASSYKSDIIDIVEDEPEPMNEPESMHDSNFSRDEEDK